MNGRVLVTGATGFIGGRVVSRLLGEGRTVRVLVRDPAGLDKRIRHGVEIVAGALEDDAALDRAITGCRAVVNLGALARACPRDPEDYFRINARAVEVMLRYAAREDVEQFVHVSSVAALVPERYAEFSGISKRPTRYGLSKTASELLVRSYAMAGRRAVIVRPSRVYGPGPWTDANATTRLMAMYLTGRLRVRLADRGAEANYVHVEDVADGVVAALHHGRPGRAYNLGGENASFVEFLAAISAASGLSRVVVPIPPQVVLPVAVWNAWWGRRGFDVSLTPEWLNNFLEHRPMDITSSREDLGYDPRPLATGVAQTLAWLVGQDGGDRCVSGAVRILRQLGA